MRDKLTPHYGLGCKRPSFSNEYLPTFNRANVSLETTPIEAITRRRCATSDGIEHEIDALVLATGFKVFDKGNMPPFPVTGRAGVDLEQWWDANRFQAYEGVSVPGFPNLFSILGPYGYNGSSYFTLIENQARHIVRCLRRARRGGATSVEVTPEANDRYFERCSRRRGRQIFFSGSCCDLPTATTSTPTATCRSGRRRRSRVAWRSARFDLDDYRFTQRSHSRDVVDVFAGD